MIYVYVALAFTVLGGAGGYLWGRKVEAAAQQALSAAKAGVATMKKSL
jgi:hypothetical protein